MGEFYLIRIVPLDGVTQKHVEAKMDLAADWMRMGIGSWIVYTIANADKWFSRLKSLVENDGRLLIVKLDLHEYQGWMPGDFWEWLEKER
jgi:hypothetical protein